MSMTQNLCLHFLHRQQFLKLDIVCITIVFSLTIFLCNESTIWRPKSVLVKRAAKTIMLHSCDVQNCEDRSATMVEKREM